MDVDRVSQMNGVGREATPVWPKSARQRRKSAPSESTAGDPEEESTGAESDPGEPQIEDESPSDDDAEATEGSRIDVMA